MTKTIKNRNCSPWNNTINITSVCCSGQRCSGALRTENYLLGINGLFLLTILRSLYFCEKTRPEETKIMDFSAKSADFVFSLFWF